VIHGGRSGEHEISMRSAQAIMERLDPAKYEVLPYLIGRDGTWSPRAFLPEPGGAPGVDVVFPVLHGTFGEDGTVQGLLELLDLPYVGAGVLASSLCMDKELMKRVCREHGLPVVEWVTLWRERMALEAPPFAYPVFVKPANLGSSVGISKARNDAELASAVRLAARYDRKVIVERAIDGQELECSVLGNDDPQASVPCEIVPSREFYDYEDKYELDAAQFHLPARLPEAQIEEVRRLAVAAYRATECAGMARVDFLRESSTGRIYINEINTIPGFTSISMYPKMWEHSGLSFPRLLDRLIELAYERHARKKETRFAR
jgi:D-alanine-D-alanine ligase